MNSKRPVNLDFRTIKLPLPAYTSIIHRISGIILFVAIAFLLYGLDLSLESESGFNSLKQLMQGFFAKLIVWGIVSALLYHLVAGLKHLLMDVGIGEEEESGILGAKITIAASAILIITAGIVIW